MLVRFVLFASLAACAFGVRAEVHKCVNAAGQVTFQDTECPQDSNDTIVKMVAPPHAPPPPAPSNADDAPPPVEPPVATRTRHDTAAGVPSLWVCTRPEDGEQYMSKDGLTPVRMVPAGVLGMPSKSLNEAYSGPNGIGVSAPGVRPTPIDRSAAGSAAGGYVAVQDRCEPASKEQVCQYLEKEYDRVHEKLRRAFNAERATLEPQQAELENQLTGCFD